MMSYVLDPWVRYGLIYEHYSAFMQSDFVSHARTFPYRLHSPLILLSVVASIPFIDTEYEDAV